MKVLERVPQNLQLSLRILGSSLAVKSSILRPS